MKTTLALTVALCLAAAAGADEAKGKKVDYQVHGRGYFESNKSGLKGPASYLAFTDMDAFKKVFGIGFTMGKKPNVLPKDAFDSKIAVAVIKRGNAIWSYEVEKVTADDGTLFVQYKATSKDGGTAKYASPLIISVEKGKYSKVEFIENGKKAGSAKIGK